MAKNEAHARMCLWVTLMWVPRHIRFMFLSSHFSSVETFKPSERVSFAHLDYLCAWNIPGVNVKLLDHQNKKRDKNKKLKYKIIKRREDITKLLNNSKLNHLPFPPVLFTLHRHRCAFFLCLNEREKKKFNWITEIKQKFEFRCSRQTEKKVNSRVGWNHVTMTACSKQQTIIDSLLEAENFSTSSNIWVRETVKIILVKMSIGVKSLFILAIAAACSASVRIRNGAYRNLVIDIQHDVPADDCLNFLLSLEVRFFETSHSIQQIFIAVNILRNKNLLMSFMARK